MYKKIQYKKAFKTPKNKGVTTKKAQKCTKNKMYKTVHLYAKIVAFLCGLLYEYKPFVQPNKENPIKCT